MADRKKSQTKKNTGNSAAAKKQGSGIPKEVTIAISIVVAVILELCNFNLLGRAGGGIKYVQSGLFGCIAYVFPVALAAVILTGKLSKKDKNLRIIFGIVIFLLICMLAHLISGIDMSINITEYFLYGANDLRGGGIIGGTLSAGLYFLVQRTGSYIIIILLLLFSFFMLLRTQIIEVVRSFAEADDGEPREKKKRARADNEDDRPDKVIVSRQNRDIPVYETEEEGRTIRIVKAKGRRSGAGHVQLKRSNNKAASMRSGAVPTERTNNKARGVSSNVSIVSDNAGGDEVHEITRTAGQEMTGSAVHAGFGDVTEAERGTKAGNTAGTVRDAKTGDISWDMENTGFASFDTDDDYPDAEPAGDNISDEAAREILRQLNEEGENKSGAGTAVRENKQSSEPETRGSLSGMTLSRGEPKQTVKPKTIYRGGRDNFVLPSINNLKAPERAGRSGSDVVQMSRKLEDTLASFGVSAEVIDTQIGPSVTRFELRPGPGTKVSKFTALSDDLKLNLAVPEIRIEAPIPGKAAIGIEVPNKTRKIVRLRELLRSPELLNHKSKIAFAAGEDISGNVVVCDLAKMPHLLVAGTTGSGKSVFLNSILMCILYRAKPSEVGLIIIDPKKVEFGIYSGIPHLIKDVVTDPQQAVGTLRWAVAEMSDRYQRMQLSGVKDFKTYNEKFEKGGINPDEANPRRMPQIVIIIDELADLMMVAAKEVESLICRLAQLARAAGIHLIIATQRPSVDVITGLIKANIPARAALLVASGVDSRTIIDMTGAEKLLGNGDMLFYPTGYVKPQRVQGAFVDDDEIRKTVNYLKNAKMADYYAEEAQAMEKCQNQAEASDGGDGGASGAEGAGKYDEFLKEAGLLCIEMGKASSSMLQRRLSIGFPRAAKIIDQLYEVGAIGPQNGAKPREILVDAIQFEEIMNRL